MARVQAKQDIYSNSGKMLIAKKGRKGTAVRKTVVKPSNYNKVAVRWEGRRKLYWHQFDELIFFESGLDPHSYIAFRPDGLLDLPLPKPGELYSYHFGTNLRQFREAAHMPQWKLAKLLTAQGTKVSQTTISYWERSDDAPNGVFVAALSRSFRLPVFLFFINFRDCDWLRKVRSYLGRLADVVCEEVIT
jgi:DNA-binding XRE family transcriptional regulator